MSYNHPRSGRRTGFGGGRPQRRSFQPKMGHINPQKYVNHVTEEVAEIEHPIINSFADFGLHPQLLRNIQQSGYTQPTPIQDQAIPAMMAGRDVVGMANTGTGKTAAFLLPLINKVANNMDEGVLIVVPTRELATQIQDEFRKFAEGLRIGVALCVGGLNIQTQMYALRKNPHFVIGTPGRLKDLMNRRALDTSMFTNIVLDEVDRMLDIGFVADIRFLIAQIPTERHSYFFSATMNREAEAIMKVFLKDPVQISVKTRITSQHIHQDIVRVDAGRNKIDVLHDLLIQKEFDRVIVFGRTKHGINKLEQVLQARGVRVTAIHGNKTQGARQRSLDQFKRGQVQALLATDVAARGIDVSNVSHVINYDEPQTYEDYIHRIGRTGRAGKIGKALTFLG